MRHFIIETFYSVRKYAIRKAGDDGIYFLTTLIAILLVFSIRVFADNDIEKRLEAGEIIASSEDVEGTKVKRGQVLGLVDAPTKVVWQVITDVNNFEDFMPRTLESSAVDPSLIQGILEAKPKKLKDLKKMIGAPVEPKKFRFEGGEYSIYLYCLLDFPWPIGDKWYIIKIDRDESRIGEGIYKSSWDLVVGNLKTNQGSWYLEPHQEGRTRVTYKLLTDPGGSIPNFLINFGTEVTMPDIIRAVRKRSNEIMHKEK